MRCCHNVTFCGPVMALRAKQTFLQSARTLFAFTLRNVHTCRAYTTEKTTTFTSSARHCCCCCCCCAAGMFIRDRCGKAPCPSQATT